MADPDLHKSFRKRDSTPFLLFLLISIVLNGIAAFGGYWIKLPSAPLEEKPIELTELDANDVEKLGSPDAPDDQPPPPEPEPTPPPLEPEPTPPPLDKPPEFEVPQPTPTPTPEVTPTPTPEPTPEATPTPESTPRPRPLPTPHEKPAVKPIVRSNGPPTANPGHATGLVKGSPTGAPNGTGHPGAHGLFARSPKPSYPPQAMQMHITGSVRVAITVVNGRITGASGVAGPPMLASYAARYVRENWEASPGQNGTFTLPISFEMR